LHYWSGKTSRAALHLMAVARHYFTADMRGASRWKDNTKMNLQEVSCGAWTGLIWLRLGTGGGHL